MVGRVCAGGAGLLDPRAGGAPGAVSRVVGGSLGWLALVWISLVPALDGPLWADPSSVRAGPPERDGRAASGADGWVG
ncbi:hypothetical protein, partial [Mycobacterium marinum]|uniref:hypothetical protein n=2 Tax=Mycobacterium marinum TaxID=1781 RepID=UPI0023514D28